MPFQPHDDAETPAGNDLVWRYMDLPKFMSLLVDRALYMPSVLSIAKADPYEGVMTDKQHEAIRTLSRLMDSIEGDGEKPSDNASIIASLFIDPPLNPKVEGPARELVHEEINRGHEYVSCWHLNGHESDAMWKLYGLKGQGIAIRSSVKRLKDAIESAVDPIHIGRVRYEDYSTYEIPPGQPVSRLLTKRRSFQHENELRMIVVKHPPTPGLIGFVTPGINVPLNLNRLIESIWLAPDADPWMQSLIQKIAVKYLSDPPTVHQSRLNRRNPVQLPVRSFGTLLGLGAPIFGLGLPTDPPKPAKP